MQITSVPDLDRRYIPRREDLSEDVGFSVFYGADGTMQYFSSSIQDEEEFFTNFSIESRKLG